MGYHVRVLLTIPVIWRANVHPKHFADYRGEVTENKRRQKVGSKDDVMKMDLVVQTRR